MPEEPARRAITPDHRKSNGASSTLIWGEDAVVTVEVGGRIAWLDRVYFDA